MEDFSPRKVGRPRKDQKKKAKEIRINHSNPKVAEHIAKVALKNAMDMEETVKELKPEAGPQDTARLARLLERSETVQNAIKFELENAGLDEISGKEYVRRIWEWFDKANQAMEPIYMSDGQTRDYKLETRRAEAAQQYAITAAKILQKAFISEKVENVQPSPMKITGFESGIKKMLGGPEVATEDFDA